MDNRDLDCVATELLPCLAVLTLTKQQAVNQLKGCAGEHRDSWRAIVYLLENTIRVKESEIASRMGLAKFKTRKGVKI